MDPDPSEQNVDPDLNLNYFARNLQPSSRVMPHLFVLLDAVLRRIPRPGSQRKQVGHTLGEEKKSPQQHTVRRKI